MAFLQLYLDPNNQRVYNVYNIFETNVSVIELHKILEEVEVELYSYFGIALANYLNKRGEMRRQPRDQIFVADYGAECVRTLESDHLLLTCKRN